MTKKELEVRVEELESELESELEDKNISKSPYDEMKEQILWEFAENLTLEQLQQLQTNLKKTMPKERIWINNIINLTDM